MDAENQPQMPAPVRAAYAYARRRGIVPDTMYIVQTWEEAGELTQMMMSGKLEPRVYLRDPFGPALKGMKR